MKQYYTHLLQIDFYKKLSFSFIVLVFIYTSIKALLLSITHDEAMTFLHYVSGSYSDILLCNGPSKANNHLLNTLLIKALTSVFGDSEFVIRIPALVGFALYLTGAYLVISIFMKGWQLVLGLLLLILHPFLNDYFSCARGYSLGLGFFMLGIYYLIKWIQNRVCIEDSKELKLSVFLFALAVISNLTFLNAYLSLISIIVVIEMYNLYPMIMAEKHIIPKFLKNCAGSMAYPTLLLIVVYTVPIIRMVVDKEFYFGGTTGFWHDTVRSLINISVFGKDYKGLSLMVIGEFLVIFVVFLSLHFVITNLLHRQTFKLIDKIMLLVMAFLFSCMTSTVLQNFLFDTKLLVGRSAIFFIPLFLLLVLIVLEKSISAKKGIIMYLAVSLLCPFVVANLIHYGNCVSVKSYYSMQRYASTKDVVKYIKQQVDGKGLAGNAIKLGVSWEFEPTINFYIERYRLNCVQKVDRGGPVGNFDYYYVLNTDNNIIQKYGLTLIREYPISNSFLAARNSILENMTPY